MTDILTSMNHSVGAKGQVVIPKHIRDSLHIQPGQELVFEQRGDEIVIRKSQAQPLKGRFAGSGMVAALREERQEERERDAHRA